MKNVDYQWWRPINDYIEEIVGKLGLYDFKINSFDLERSMHVQYSGTFSARMMKLEKLTDTQKEELKWFIEPITEQAALCHTQDTYLWADVIPSGRIGLDVDWAVQDGDYYRKTEAIEGILDTTIINGAFYKLADWMVQQLQKEYNNRD